MTFKRVSSSVAGDATHFGGDDVNKFSDYLGGTDIGGTETVDIATLTAFRHSKLTLRNPANTFSYVFVPAAIAASRNVTLPLLTGNDTLVTEAFAQTLTNKTLISPIISSISNTGTLTLPTTSDTLVGISTSDTLVNKNINATNNTITDTSTAAGDILAGNGTKFVRKAKGTALQVLRTNSGASDIEWASLDSERVGKSTANGNGSTTVFTIAHGLGSNPTYTFIDCSSHSIARTFTTDSTNITVTFASAPSSGTNNVIIYWRVVA